MRAFFITILLIVLTSCSENKLNFDDVVKSQVLAEKEFNNKGYITATASQQNENLKFRIKSYLITFDFKSEKDGSILFIGKRDKGTEDIWWQF